MRSSRPRSGSGAVLAGLRRGWLVTILQRAEKLTDRQAAEAVRTRIDWQYLLGLPLDDPGFDHTVPAEFRARVADAGLEQAALDAPRALRRAHTVPGPGTGCPQRLLQDQPGAQPADRLDRIDMLVDRFQRLIELAAKPLAGGYSRHAREPPSASTCQVKDATPALQGETVRIWGRSYA